MPPTSVPDIIIIIVVVIVSVVVVLVGVVQCCHLHTIHGRRSRCCWNRHPHAGLPCRRHHHRRHTLLGLKVTLNRNSHRHLHQSHDQYTTLTIIIFDILLLFHLLPPHPSPMTLSSSCSSLSTIVFVSVVVAAATAAICTPRCAFCGPRCNAIQPDAIRPAGYSR